MITIKTLPDASAQEVFDQVANHLFTQNKKSLGGQSAKECQYRGPEGLKCAAGCLIADDEYDPSMEGKRWFSLARISFMVPEIHVELITELQDIHDDYETVVWRKKLKLLAERHSLEFKFAE